MEKLSSLIFRRCEKLDGKNSSNVSSNLPISSLRDSCIIISFDKNRSLQRERQRDCIKFTRCWRAQFCRTLKNYRAKCYRYTYTSAVRVQVASERGFGLSGIKHLGYPFCKAREGGGRGEGKTRKFLWRIFDDLTPLPPSSLCNRRETVQFLSDLNIRGEYFIRGRDIGATFYSRDASFARERGEAKIVSLFKFWAREDNFRNERESIQVSKIDEYVFIRFHDVRLDSSRLYDKIRGKKLEREKRKNG